MSRISASRFSGCPVARSSKPLTTFSHCASSDLEVCTAGGAYKCIGLEPESTASTPMFTMLRILLLLQLARPGWTARLGDVSTAFLHAPLSQQNEKPTYIWPKELCPQQNSHARTTQFTKGMARLLGTSSTRTTLRTTKARTQRLHFAYKRLLHHGAR